jgi:hypothetical protein
MLLMYLSSDLRVLSSLLATPPFRVVKFTIAFLPKFWMELYLIDLMLLLSRGFP